MKTALRISGVAALLMGLLWIGQGLGLVRWPSNSFMIEVRVWTLWGAVLAAAGAAALFFSTRLR